MSIFSNIQDKLRAAKESSQQRKLDQAEKDLVNQQREQKIYSERTKIEKTKLAFEKVQMQRRKLRTQAKPSGGIFGAITGNSQQQRQQKTDAFFTGGFGGGRQPQQRTASRKQSFVIIGGKAYPKGNLSQKRRTQPQQRQGMYFDPLA